MGLGILDTNKLSHVPGTVLLDEEAGHTESQTANLKHGTGKDANIILAPQPSEDPNDPLNWSALKKEYVLAILLFGSIINAATQVEFLLSHFSERSSRFQGPLLAAGLVTIAIDFNKTITQIAQISGYYLLVCGGTGPFISAFATKWGKRPIFFFSSFFGVLGTIVGCAATGYNSLLAARIITGFSTSAYESVIMAAVGDLYFVHQRGIRVSVVNFVLAAISNGYLFPIKSSLILVSL